MATNTRSPDHHAFAPNPRGDSIERAFANALPQIIWTADTEGQLEWVNDRWFELTGQTEEQTFAEGGPLEAVHPDDRDELMRRWGQAHETLTQSEIEYRIRTKTGEYRWHLGRTSPVLDERGKLVRWVAVAIDIHDRRSAEDALRASERRFETVFDLSPQPLAITRESDGCFLVVNDALCELFGFTREELLGKTSLGLGIWSAHERAAFLASIDAGSRPGAEVSKRNKNGRTVRVILQSARSVIDGVPCLVNAVTDVTAQRASDDALRRADRLKDEFLALLSHELRNPLTPILTSARLLERQVDAEGRQDVAIIVRQVKHMVRLVDDLVDLSRVARGSVTLSKTRLDLATVVSHAVTAAAPLFEARSHRLQVSIPEKNLDVDGDEVRLTQIVDNLLSNAARYTPPGGVVTVSAERDDGSVVLRVRDTGVGIDPALLPDLFDAFVQGTRGPDRSDGGLGIGLSLVRTLTELHGGKASAHSRGPGTGSEFVVRLPSASNADPPEESSIADSYAHASASPSSRILLVDDHADVIEGLSRLLSVLGYDFRAAADPLDAIELAERFRPEIAILDIGLPKMDGYELARELRARLADPPPTLIALSGYGQPQDRRRSDEAGFAAHLVKPIDVDELIATLSLFSVTDRGSHPIHR